MMTSSDTIGIVLLLSVVALSGPLAFGEKAGAQTGADSSGVPDSLSSPARVIAGPDSTAPPAEGRAASAEDVVMFPEARGSNLEGREFSLPADFEGEINLVFIAFQREHQALVDTWVPFAKEIAERHPQLRYYELPTIRKLNSVTRWFIDNGMRRGIPDVSAREATITLYLDKEPFREALRIPHENTIYVLLVDAEGRVAWRTEGAYTGDHGTAIEQFVAEKLSAE